MTETYNGHQLPFEFFHSHEESRSVTDVAPQPSSYIARSSAQDAVLPETVVTPEQVREMFRCCDDCDPNNDVLGEDVTELFRSKKPKVADQQNVQPGTKYDGAKPRTDLLPVYPMIEEAKVLAYGAEKYNARNWEAGFDWSRAYGALLRHLFAFWQGEDIDPESGLHHLAHARCELDFLFEFTRTHKEFDDRPQTNTPRDTA